MTDAGLKVVTTGIRIPTWQSTDETDSAKPSTNISTRRELHG
ncbi:hypothetical protein [Streptomyces malaysiensis]|nr:hypothetical protein [Streptomyces malaysiensis]